MERPQYCVYNQTNECFLSLGVTQGDNALTHLKGLLGARTQRYDEGNWVARPKGFHLFRFFSSRDLVFLDEQNRVIRTIESFPPFRFATVGPEVASVLELPVRTIGSSQTQSGNQLVICVAEEMEFRLRSMPDFEADDFDGSARDFESQNELSEALDRRRARRKRWPRLVAYDSAGGTLEVHGVRDMSANGLYLMTEERWPLGTLVTMTLQRTDGLDENAVKNTIVVQLRVIRWGRDGVGLSFLQSEVEKTGVMALSSAR